MNKPQRDVVIEGRLDSRDLATCARYMVDKGCPINSMSELMYFVTQLAVYAIGHNEFETTGEAREYMQSIGLGGLNRSGRGLRTLQKSLQQEDLKAEGFNPQYGARTQMKGKLSDTELENMARSAMKLVEKEQIPTEEALKETMDSILRSKDIMLNNQPK